MYEERFRVFWGSAAVLIGCVFLSPLTVCAQVTISTQKMIYPADSGLIDITAAPYFAKGDGVTDNTAVIQQAIYDHVMKTAADWTARDQALYFPDGVYLISNTLAWKGPGGWSAYFSFYGESESGTIIKLKDGSSGFTDPTTSKPVIETASAFSTDPVWGSGNNAFRNHLADLTIDVGNNPGAEAVSWVATNVGELRNVLLTAAAGNGAYGIDGGHGLSPAIVKNVTIHGFGVGIYLNGSGGLTIDHLALSQQEQFGLWIDGNEMSIRDLESNNRVPAIHLWNNASFLSLIDSQLTGGSSSSSALQIDSPPNEPTGHYFLRNNTSDGYASLMTLSGQTISGSSVTETTSLPPLSLFASPSSSMNLPIQETPDVYDPDLSHWTNALQFVGSETTPGDIGQALQAAIDESGATTIYLPHGVYTIGTTVHVHGSVKEIIGFGIQIVPINAQHNPTPVFEIDSNAADAITLRGLTFEPDWASDSSMIGYPAVLNTSPNTVVIRDSEMLSYDNVSGAGPLFLEDVNYGAPSQATYEFNNEMVWARQLNPECEIASAPYCSPSSKVTNNGGTLWVLGVKTEGHHTPAFSTISGGKTEVLGGYFLVVPDAVEEKVSPIFVSKDSAESLVYTTGSGEDWDNQIIETRNGQTKTQPALLNRYAMNTSMPLFVGYSATAALTPAPSIIPNGGAYSSSSTVTLQCSPGSTVYYTLDGSPPSPSSTRYSQPFSLTQTTTVNAIAQSSITGLSTVTAASFVIHQAILSVSTTSITFDAVVTNGTPPPQTLSISNTGTADVTWSLAPAIAPWLSVTPVQGTLAAGQEQRLSLSVNLTALGSGYYQLALPIVGTGAIGSPGIVHVSLTFEEAASPLFDAGIRVFPNPWRKDKATKAQISYSGLGPNATVKLFTVAGHWVKDVTADSSGNAVWDLTNMSGDAVASGLYMYVVKTGSGQKTKGLVAILR